MDTGRDELERKGRMTVFDDQCTVVIIPHNSDGVPIWDLARPIMFPRDYPGVFASISDLETLTKHCGIILKRKVYRRNSMKSTFDFSQGSITYFIHVVEVPEEDEEPGIEQAMDVDAAGKPIFKVIQGGKSNAQSAA